MGFVGDAVGGLFGGLGSGAPQNGFRSNAAQYSDQDRQNRFLQAIQDAKQRDVANNQFRQSQMGLLGQLQNTADTAQNRPSVAEALLRQSQDQNLAQSNALASSARGDVNPGMIQRIAQSNLANQNQVSAQQAAALKAQESIANSNLALQAQSQMGQVMGQGRTQDIQSQQQVDDLTTKYEAMGLQADQARMQAQVEVDRLNAAVEAGNLKARQDQAGMILNMASLGLSSGGGPTKSVTGGGGGDSGGSGGAPSDAAAGAGASALVASDEKLKKNVKGGDDAMYRFLDALSAHQYKYKQPEVDGEGEHYSVMAQELEKTPVGRSMVEDTSRGKMVDYGKGYGAILAAQAALHDRLKELESKMPRRK